jgi:hypothetical protein
VVKTITMRMHRDWSGQCWADSHDLAGYTAAGMDFTDVMGLVHEAIDWAVPPQLEEGQEVDLRWQWCNDSLRAVRALRVDGKPACVIDKPCPCADREEGQA